jgi:predicted DNA-binding transcriptional regulator AlpA
MTTEPASRSPRRRTAHNARPLLSVEQTAVLLGESRSAVYRSIERGDFPIPVFRINGRLRIARRSVERLIDGDLPIPAMAGIVKGGKAGEHSERTLDEPDREGIATQN